ncbi:MAG: arginine--tRNA ligase [Syntrophobacterales bacterium]|nr:arginine--tRNA ligase [Syntrophobacterales bacterium]
MIGSLRKQIAQLIANALEKCAIGDFSRENLPFIEVEETKEKIHGDYATNVAMVLASKLKMPPRKIAASICDQFDGAGVVERVEIAGPGFINFFVDKNIWPRFLEDVDSMGVNYGTGNGGQGQKIQIEFVSANPTGPLHIGHARGAVVGDVIARLLTACGYQVSKEYYINDAGNQMNNLGRSVYFRLQELSGEKVDFPQNCYQGAYIRDLAQDFLRERGSAYVNKSEGELIPELTRYASQIILAEIKEDLRMFGVTFDCYFSEQTLHENNGVMALLQELEEAGFVYREDGTKWFKTTLFGDEKDRVVVRQNGEPTYFAADIAYHKDKFARGYKTVIDVWGADHHGYIPRMQACVQALGFAKDAIKIVLVQLVNLLRDGQPVAMSTRAGQFDTLRQVIDEVGTDAARYNFLMRRSDSHLDFDLELAKKQSNENPVYYVQYAHARICSILRLAAEKGCHLPRYSEVNARYLTMPDEIDLIKIVSSFPELVEDAAAALEPHRLTFYANDLAGQFHSYYNKNKVIAEDQPQSEARLFLIKAVQVVLANVLRLLGVSAPEKM